MGATCEEPDLTYEDEVYEEFRDNITGQVLDHDAVKKARAEELTLIDKLGVWVEVPEAQCYQSTGRAPISTRWVDINKGDDERVEIRSRLVARELKAQQQREGQTRDDVFSATPPHEGIRLLFSLAMTEDGVDDKKMIFIDISRAHFHSPARREIYVALPPERGRPGFCAKLQKSMYGTRDAAANFASMVMDTLRGMGFEIGVFNPCLCRHAGRGLMLFYHGDDFVCLGPADNIQWFADALNKHLIVKVRGVLGGGDNDLKEITLLNRIVRWGATQNGTSFLEWEADPRHAEIIIKQLGLNGAMKAKAVSTPGLKKTLAELTGSDELVGDAISNYRSICMRINYLAMDRPELLYAAKEAARWMAHPTATAMEMIKRVGRYLVGSPRLVQQMVMQPRVGKLTCKVDADHAGCLRTRRSTTGLALFHGSHLIKASSHMQTVQALSTAESEFYAIVRGTAVGLGAVSMGRDYGVGFKLEVATDASAGRGIALRLGAGKLRHLHTQYLWAQGVYHRREAVLIKIPGLGNEADLMTKHLAAPRMQELLRQAGFQVRAGRSKLGLRAAATTP